jgi:hypothetical protein
MTNLSARTWVLMGFAISIVAVTINVFVLSSLNDRIKDVDGELSKLNASLGAQAAEINNAEIKYDLYTILNHTAQFAEGEQKEAAGYDSISMLRDYLKRHYAAVYDIPTSDFVRAETEELATQLEIGERIKTAIPLAQAGKTEEANKIIEQGSKDMKNWQPKTELGKKLHEAAATADHDKLSDKDTSTILLEIMPAIKSTKEQFIANYQKKQDRIRELQERKSNLSGWQSIFTYLAVSLQLFGLMFVLTKDLVKDTKERRDKARKEAEAAEAEARSAEIEAAEANARAKQANIEADKAVALADKRIEKATKAAEEAMKIAGGAREGVEELFEEDGEEKEEKMKV